jgi:DNA-binding response OmpR family regulator
MEILFIEDTVELGEIVREILVLEGYTVNWFTDPLEALTRFHSRTPDLVITDVVMPKLNGWEIIRIMRQSPSGSTLPIIVLSAKASPEDEQASYAAGADAHLKKPCKSSDLVYQIKFLLQCKQA